MAEVDELVVKISADLSDIKKELNVLNRTGEKTAKGMGALSNSTKKLSQGFRGLTGSVVPLIATFGGLSKVVSSFNQAIDVGKTAKTLGITTEQFSRLNNVMLANGATSDQLADAMKDVTERIGDAAKGGTAYEEALNGIGLSSRELINLDADQQFLKVADALGEASDQGSKLFAAATLGGDGLRDMVGVLDDIGQPLSEAAIGMEKFIKPLTDFDVERLKQINKEFVIMNQTISNKLVTSIVDFNVGWSIASDEIRELQGVTKQASAVMVQFGDFATATGILLRQAFQIGITAAQGFVSIASKSIVEASQLINEFSDLFGGGNLIDQDFIDQQRDLGKQMAESFFQGLEDAGNFDLEGQLTEAFLAAQERNAELRKAKLEQDKFTEIEFTEFQEKLLKQYTDTEAAQLRTQLTNVKTSNIEKLRSTSSYLGHLATLTNTSSRKMFEFGKAAGISQALVDTYLGANKALASVPYPFNIAAAAAVVASGLNNVNNIRNQSFGGGGGGGSPSSATVPTSLAETPTQGPQETVQTTEFNVTLGGQGGQSNESVRALLNDINDQTDDGFILKTTIE